MPLTKSILVLEWNGCRLRGAVARRRRGDVKLERLIESRELEPHRAIADVVGQMRSGGVPRRAILLTTEAVPARLELPVDPRNPRSVEQMAEMVRWELDGHLAAHPTSLPMDEVLVGLGYLSRAQLHRLHTLKQSADAQQKSPSATARIEELAVADGLISREQADAATTVRNRHAFDVHDDCYCGWAAVHHRKETLSAAQLGNSDSFLSMSAPGQHPWLAAGIGTSARARWGLFCRSVGVVLTEIYPMAGCGAMALAEQSSADTTLVIEFLPGLASISTLNRGQVQSIELTPRDPVDTDLGVCYALLKGRHSQDIWLCGAQNTLEELSASTLPLRLAGINGAPTACLAMYGAARHTLLPSGSRMAVVAAQDPPPAVWRRLPVHAGAMLLLLGAMIAGVERTQQRRLNEARLAQDAAEQQRADMIAEKERLEQLHKQVATYTENLKVSEQELQSAEQRNRLIAELIPAGNRLLSDLLSALATTVTDDVVVEAVLLEGDRVQVSAWSLSEMSAQRFVYQLTSSIGRWRMRSVDVSVEARQGSLGLDGYGVGFSLTHFKEILPSESTRVAVEH